LEKKLDQLLRSALVKDFSVLQKGEVVELGCKYSRWLKWSFTYWDLCPVL